MIQEDYKVVISETYKGTERVYSPLKKEKNKSEIKQRAKWYNLLLKISKIKE